MRPIPLCILLACGGIPTVQATQLLRVTTTADQFDGVCNQHCSLRDAVEVSNKKRGTQLILLPAGRYLISLPPERGDPSRDEEDVRIDEDGNRNGDLDIRGRLSIVGAGIGQTIIDAQHTDRIMEVAKGGSLLLSKLTLTGGYSSFEGGALHNRGLAVLDRVRLENNQTYHPFGGGTRYGGAIANYGQLLISRSELVGNQASGGDSTAGYGGALHNSGWLIGRDLLLADNRARNSDDSAGEGGALHNLGRADISRALFRGNHGDRGGALVNDRRGQLRISHSTFAANSSSESHNGIIQNGTWQSGTAQLNLAYVTLADNRGLGLLNYGRLKVEQSIVGGNIPHEAAAAVNCINQEGGRLQIRGLLMGSDGGNCNADLPFADASLFPAVLLPLSNNGGLTQTFALPAGSPALDAVKAACHGQDQRGVRRPRDGNGDRKARCDLGAYER
jgi:CSLREA domain-containing protein